jgi:CO/xanthine dehydrogenase Mo-binding subunit
MTAWRFIGKSLPRSEDRRLLAGLGRYTSDLAARDVCRPYIVRSPHATARIGGIDTHAAAAMPDVRPVLTPGDPEVARQRLLHGYAMPRAADLPFIACQSNEVLTNMNPLDAKGAGEAGTVGALVVVINALFDALAPLGIDHVDMPATPERRWLAIRAARAT